MFISSYIVCAHVNAYFYALLYLSRLCCLGIFSHCHSSREIAEFNSGWSVLCNLNPYRRHICMRLTLELCEVTCVDLDGH